MATLTGQKIKDTYDGLLKTDVSSIGLPASGKVVITDGLGNDSALSLGKINNGAEITGTLTIDKITDSTASAAVISEIITEAKTIAANDNDTSIPTSAAVKDYVDAVPAESLAQTLAQGNTTSGKDIEMSDGDDIKFGPEFVLSKGGSVATGNLQGDIRLSNGNSNSKLRIMNQNGKVQLFGRDVLISANETQINGGFVGINTVNQNPQDQLHVNGTIRAAMALNNGSTNPTGWAFIALNDLATAASGIWYANRSAKLILKNSSNVETISIRADGKTTFNGGKVGVNTTTPIKDFEVQGVARINTLDFERISGINFISAGNNSIIYFGQPSSYVQNVSVNGVIRSNTSIQFANNTATPSAQLEGSQRYYKTSNASYVDVCMQTGATTYAWVNIKTNTW